MSTQGLHQDIYDTLEIESMTEAERDRFFETIGAIVIESTLLRFAVELEPTDRAEFEKWVSQYDDVTKLLSDAPAAYPGLTTILDEQVVGLHDYIRPLSRV